MLPGRWRLNHTIGNNADDNADAGEQAQPELLRCRLEQRCVAVGQRLPRDQGEDDGDKVADRREDEEARIALGLLEITGGGEPDEESDVHAGVVPEEGSFAARIVRGKALRQHHVDAGHVQAAAGEEEGEADVEQRERAARDARATDDLERHAPDEEIPVRHEAPAEVAAEEMQAVVERAKHAHQRRGQFRRELEMLRRVEDERRVKNREPERREDLDEEQDRRSFGSFGETVFERLHQPPFRWLTRLMSSAPLGSARASLARRSLGKGGACGVRRLAEDFFCSGGLRPPSQVTSSPPGTCPGRRNVFTNSPSPQTIIPEKRLNHRPSETSGSETSQSAN